jgi:hypothetical protein
VLIDTQWSISRVELEAESAVVLGVGGAHALLGRVALTAEIKVGTFLE